MTDAQLKWLKDHPQYVPCKGARSGENYKDCGTLYADGSFVAIEPSAPGSLLMKPVVLREGCRLVGVPRA